MEEFVKARLAQKAEAPVLYRNNPKFDQVATFVAKPLLAGACEVRVNFVGYTREEARQALYVLRQRVWQVFRRLARRDLLTREIEGQEIVFPVEALRVNPDRTLPNFAQSWFDPSKEGYTEGLFEEARGRGVKYANTAEAEDHLLRLVERAFKEPAFSRPVTVLFDDREEAFQAIVLRLLELEELKDLYCGRPERSEIFNESSDFFHLGLRLFGYRRLAEVLGLDIEDEDQDPVFDSEPLFVGATDADLLHDGLFGPGDIFGSYLAHLAQIHRLPDIGYEGLFEEAKEALAFAASHRRPLSLRPSWYLWGWMKVRASRAWLCEPFGRWLSKREMAVARRATNLFNDGGIRDLSNLAEKLKEEGLILNPSEWIPFLATLIHEDMDLLMDDLLEAPSNFQAQVEFLEAVRHLPKGERTLIQALYQGEPLSEAHRLAREVDPNLDPDPHQAAARALEKLLR